MNIFVLMAALVAAATARSLCPDTQFCDVTNIITSCQSEPWVHESSEILVLTGVAHLMPFIPKECVTILSAGSITLNNLTLTSSDIKIFAGITYEEYQQKKDYYAPGTSESNYKLFILKNSTVSANGFSPLRDNKTIEYGGSYAANGGSSDNPSTEHFYGHGTFFSNPYVDNYQEQNGAAGYWKTTIGIGGGRIILGSSGDIEIEGSVTSIGNSFTTMRGNGGSGGYIAIDCGREFIVSDAGGTVSVQGGNGAHGGFGGSGGRIVANIKVANDRPLGGLFKLGGGNSDNCGKNGEG